MAAIYYLICAVVWGTTWFAIRVCIGAEGYPTFAGAALRFTLAAIILCSIWAVGWAGPGPRARRELGWIGIAGICNALSYGLIYYAETLIPGGLTAVLFGTFPLMVAGIAVASGTEQVKLSAVFGSVVSAGGIAIVLLDRFEVSNAQAAAVGIVLVAVLLSAIYSVIVKRVASEQHPLAASGAFFVPTAVGLWVLSWVGDTRSIPWPPPPEPTIALLYLGVVGSAVVFVAYFALIKRVRLMTMTTLVFIQPMIALVVDAMWEHGVVLGPRAYLGGAVVLLGVALNLFGGRGSARRQAGSAQPDPA